jgi:hypothetical protein
MPPRYSLINSPDLAATQGPGNIAFFSAMAALLEDPTTIAVPTNLNAGTFGMTQWFFDVFDRYLEDDTLDLNTELLDAEQVTRDYLTCVNAIPPLVPDEDGFQTFFDQIVTCQTAADPAA